MLSAAPALFKSSQPFSPWHSQPSLSALSLQVVGFQISVLLWTPAAPDSYLTLPNWHENLLSAVSFTL